MCLFNFAKDYVTGTVKAKKGGPDNLFPSQLRQSPSL